jgi:hypothetical protein
LKAAEKVGECASRSTDDLEIAAFSRHVRPMRRDMSKVIVERPRLGRKDRRRPGRDRPLEDEDGAPLRARAPRREKPLKTKALNENLNPLQRYLERQVNRPWDKVWSEVSANLKPTSTVQQHVRDHVPDFVAVETRSVGGRVMVATKWGDLVPLERSWTKLYVDPRTGILRRNPHAAGRKRAIRAAKAAHERERNARMRVVNARTQLHRLSDGAWWEVRLASAPSERKVSFDPRWPHGAAPRPDIDAEDAVLRAGLSDLSRAELYGGHGLMAVDKRQLSRREAKRRGLT